MLHTISQTVFGNIDHASSLYGYRKLLRERRQRGRVPAIIIGFRGEVRGRTSVRWFFRVSGERPSRR